MAIHLSLKDARRLRARFPELAALLDEPADAPPGGVGDGERGPAVAALVAVGLPVATEVERGEGRWTVRIANYCPASDNVRARGVRAWLKAKKADRAVVRDWLCGDAAIPRATGKRRLAVLVEKKGPMIDGANINKSLRDALVDCGLLKDDGPEWLEGVEPVVTRGKITTTTIILEDLSDG